VKWERRLFALEKDPHGASKGPGMLHRLTLRASAVGRPDFDYSTDMFIPTSMEKHQAELSLQMFEDNGRDQLLAKLGEWRDADVKKLRFIV
jgi:hypothetical protein